MKNVCAHSCIFEEVHEETFFPLFQHMNFLLLVFPVAILSMVSVNATKSNWKDRLGCLFCQRAQVKEESEVESMKEKIQNSVPDIDQEFAFWLPAFLERSKQITWTTNPRTPATKRITKEMKEILEAQSKTTREDLEYLVYVDENNFYHWMVKFINFRQNNPRTTLAKDMKRFGIDEIVTEVIFPSTYPNDPPFIRIISPRFKVPSDEVRGRIMAEGTFCTYLFVHGNTAENWKSHYLMSMVLTQIRALFFDKNGRNQYARLSGGHERQYGFQNAIYSYLSTQAKHHQDWIMPRGFTNEIRAIQNWLEI